MIATSPVMFEYYEARLGWDFDTACRNLRAAQQAFNRHVPTGIRNGCAGLKMFRKKGQDGEPVDGWMCKSPQCPSCWHIRWAKALTQLRDNPWTSHQHYYIRRTAPEEVKLGIDPIVLRKFRAAGCRYSAVCTGTTYVETIDGVGVMLVGLFGTQQLVGEYRCHDLEYNLPQEGLYHGTLTASRELVHRLLIQPGEVERLYQFITPWWFCEGMGVDEKATHLVAKLDSAPKPFRLSANT